MIIHDADGNLLVPGKPAQRDQLTGQWECECGSTRPVDDLERPQRTDFVQLVGYFAVSPQMSSPDARAKGGRLRFGRNAFAASLTKHNIRFFLSHHKELCLGSVRDGTLKVGQNAHGAWCLLTLSPTSKEAKTLLGAFHDTRGMSFQHEPAGDNPAYNFIQAADGVWEQNKIPPITECSLLTGCDPAFPHTRDALRLWSPGRGWLALN
jgi:phage head maturation protease